MKHRRWLVWLFGTAVAGLFLYLVPPFRIVPLELAKRQRAAKTLQPERLAEQLWDDRLEHVMGRAVEASELLAALRRDPHAAKNRYSQALGEGDVHYYFLTGVGRVVVVDPQQQSVGLSLDREGSAVDVSISTGYIFGNAIVDGTKLIDPNEFSSTWDFNRVSEAINRLVERRVLPPFRDAVAVGAEVRFAGCAKIVDEDRDLDPMRLVPIVLEVQPARDSPLGGT